MKILLTKYSIENSTTEGLNAIEEKYQNLEKARVHSSSQQQGMVCVAWFYQVCASEHYMKLFSRIFLLNYC